jgi:hypothetical protein
VVELKFKKVWWTPKPQLAAVAEKGISFAGGTTSISTLFLRAEFGQ